MHRHLISLAILAYAGMTALPVHANNLTVAAPSEVTTQLPRTAKPMHYEVLIAPDAKNGTFSAKTTIYIEVLQKTMDISLNAADLEFNSVSLFSDNAKSQHASIIINPERQTASFHFARQIIPGKYKLTMEYKGKIGTQAAGLFALDYDTKDGKQRALFTQFENSEARRMIPSWDEPNYKASFQLSAIVPADQMAVSNMPVNSVGKTVNGKKRVSFATTPTMSSYLLFFGLGDFERATTKLDNTELGVITKRGSLEQARFALDSSKDILREYNDYFGIKYPLPKLDNIAAPGQSQFFEAMENWGSIFTFEFGLLNNPAISTARDQENIFSTEAHEMAHQWFGNLVTMQWWDDLWLNEGFASWMESRMTERLHPEWNTGLSAVEKRNLAMSTDAFSTTHPIVQHVSTVEQASQAFDNITYMKGEAVIRMLEAYVGEDAWRNGVRSYLAKHAYGNTITNDLWVEIEQAAQKPLTDIANDFTLQPGIPLVRLDSVVCENQQSLITLSQSEFNIDTENKKPLTWRVPVTLQVLGNDEKTKVVVEGGKAQLKLDGCGPVLLNAGQSGYFRSSYDAQAFNNLSHSFAQLATIDQLGLLADTWALAFNGHQSFSDFMDIADALPLSADPKVWSQITQVFSEIHTNYASQPERQQQFAQYAIKRLKPKLDLISWTPAENEHHAIAELREQLILSLSEFNDTETIAEAHRLYDAQNKHVAAIPPELNLVILSVVAYHANSESWEELHRQAMAETSPMIKDHLYQLLAIGKDQFNAQKALKLAISDEPNKTISAGMISAVAKAYPDAAFDFALANLDTVSTLVDETSRSRYLPQLAMGSSDPTMINKLADYAQQHLTPESRKEADAAIAQINLRLLYRERNLKKIDAWLAAHT